MPNFVEPNPSPRQRLSLSLFTEEASKRKSLRSRYLKDGQNYWCSPKIGRILRCSFITVTIVFSIILLVAFFTLLHSQAIYHIEYTRNVDLQRNGLMNFWGGDKESFTGQHSYDCFLDINWNQVSSVVARILDVKNENITIGLLNFRDIENTEFKILFPDAEIDILNLNPVADDVEWKTLYPEWIDEEQEFEVPTCPILPKLGVPNRPLNLIAVKLPCNKSSDWSRDVTRLHLQIAVAGLAATFKGLYTARILLVSECPPIPNLFTCNELIEHQGNVWLYDPNLSTLLDKLRLPLGSCELAVPLNAKDHHRHPGNAPREAYATILHSAHVYVCGAIAAAQSIQMTGSTRDLVILVDETISDYHREGLETAGWKIHSIQRIRNPKAEHEAYNEWNYSKFRLWQLTDYDKIIFIDADVLILRNIDFLFEMPEISAIGNNATLFNSGVMVVEPSNCTFKFLMDHIDEIESYNGGDQGYLNEIYTWWHRIPKRMNFLKHFWVGDKEEIKDIKTRLYGADPPVLYVLHYLGLKPWLCFRDYDCNWNVDILQGFASDVAHKTWWKVHDAMPENLHKYCLLRSKQKATLEWDRMQAEKGNYTDAHWKVKIQDPRLNICFEDFCYWESMLWHWGEKNWTDNASVVTPSLPAATVTASLSNNNITLFL